MGSASVSSPILILVAPFSKDSLLVIYGSDGNADFLSVNDLSLPGDSAPLRRYESDTQFAHLDGTTLSYFGRFSGDVYEVHTVDVRTGEEIRPLMYFPCYHTHTDDDHFFFGMTDMIIGMEVIEGTQGKFRAMCLNVNSRILTDVSASAPNGCRDILFAPTDKHKRLVCQRDESGTGPTIVLTFQ